MTRMQRPVVAAFDFDGTLTRRDTLLPFLRYLLGDIRLAGHALMLAPVLTGYGLGMIGNGRAKEQVFVRCFGGMREADLKQQGSRFAQEIVPTLLRDSLMQRFQWHQQQGHRCVVISASMALYVEPWAKQAGFSEVIATQLHSEAGILSGKMQGANCYGAEKVTRLAQLLGDRAEYELYAYGDSRGDRELLAYADHAYFRGEPVTEKNETI